MRMKEAVSGFTLTELLVVIGLISIFMAIACIDFSSWQKKYSIENQAREMLVDLSDYRVKSMQAKCNHVAVLSASPLMMTFRRYSTEEQVTLTSGKQVLHKYLKHPISRNAMSSVPCGDIGFNARGYSNDFLPVMSGGTFASNQTIYVLPTGTGAATDCLVISATRINLGRYNGTNCSFQ